MMKIDEKNEITVKQKGLTTKLRLVVFLSFMLMVLVTFLSKIIFDQERTLPTVSLKRDCQA